MQTWKCIFNETTMVGTGCNREPQAGETALDIDATLCGWFNVYPERYRLEEGQLVEVETWQAEYDAKLAADTKIKAELDIRSEASRQLLSLGAPYSPEERETWMIQESEARAYLANNTASCPMVTAMATARGITVELMVQKIIENSDAFKLAAGQILGLQQKNIDLLG
jgi:hypothetical protein